MNNNNEYFHRMVNEAEDLQKKTIALSKFSDTDLFKSLSSEKQKLMNIQFSYMMNYLDILKKRIELDK